MSALTAMDDGQARHDLVPADPARLQEGVQAYLAHYRDLTLKGLLSALPRREPRRYLYDPIQSHLERMGKGLRPALCMASCRALGGQEEQALTSAVALEMLHNAFLVHDDVEDGSQFRHARPTMQAEYGIPLAVNAGDALNALSLKLLRENLPGLGSELTWQVFEEVGHLMLQSLEGQALELGWIRDNRCDVTEEDYLRMVLKKTCWYSFIQPCRIGALIATRDPGRLDRYNLFGYYIGSAFQIQDDVLNLIGEDHKYGKEIGGDLLEGKRTLMLVHLLKHCNGAERRRLQGFLDRTRSARSAGELSWVLERMGHYGSIDYARSVSRHFAGAALYEFHRAYGDAPDSEDKTFIQRLVHYMVSRDL